VRHLAPHVPGPLQALGALEALVFTHVLSFHCAAPACQAPLLLKSPRLPTLVIHSHDLQTFLHILAIKLCLDRSALLKQWILLPALWTHLGTYATQALFE